MRHLSETLRVRVDAELRAELERQAVQADRPAAYLARVILREGLERRRLEREEAGRGR